MNKKSSQLQNCSSERQLGFLGECEWSRERTIWWKQRDGVVAMRAVPGGQDWLASLRITLTDTCYAWHMAGAGKIVAE